MCHSLAAGHERAISRNQDWRPPLRTRRATATSTPAASCSNCERGRAGLASGCETRAMPELAPDGFPLPPKRLIARAGATPGDDIVAEYLRGGAANKATLAAIAAGEDPGYWSTSRNILDFGCGAGNVLRHFGREARHGEVWGCDVDADSIAWLSHNLCPPFRVATVSPT